MIFNTSWFLVFFPVAQSNEGDGPPIRRPAAVPVAAQIIVDRAVTSRRQLQFGLVPRMAGLPAAVPQDHHRRVARAGDVGNDVDPAGYGNADGFGMHGGNDARRPAAGQSSI